MRLLPQRRRNHDRDVDHRGHELIRTPSANELKEPAAGSFFYPRSSGFSLAELIAIIVIVGILSVVALGRFNDGVARTRGVYDALLAQFQFARKMAVAQRRPICVHVDAAQSRLFYGADTPPPGQCPATVPAPSATGEAPFKVDIPAGVAVTAAVFRFDALGRYRTAVGAPTTVPLVLAVDDGQVNLQITIEHETGYVR